MTAERRPDLVARAAIVTFASILLHFAYVTFEPRFTTGPLRQQWAQLATEPTAVARALSERGAFADPYATMPTGPTAHLAPAWPVALAVLFRLAHGDLASVSKLAFVATAVLWALTLLALPVISREIWGTEAPGLIGLWIGMLPLVPITPIWEAVPSAAGLAWGCVAMMRCAPRICGLIAGGLALLNPVAAHGMAVFWLVRRRPGVKEVALFAAFGVLVVVPWIVRNFIVLGHFVPVRDNFGLEFKLAYRDQATLTLAELLNAKSTTPHPNESAAEGMRLRSVGEVVYMNACAAEAIGWIREHPGKAVRLTLQRAVLWWFPYRKDLVPYPLLTCAAAFLGLVGLSATPRLGLPLAGLLLSFSAPYYLVSSCCRYTVPVIWIFLLGVGFLSWRIAFLALGKGRDLDRYVVGAAKDLELVRSPAVFVSELPGALTEIRRSIGLGARRTD
jgi:hypothetical protein